MESTTTKTTIKGRITIDCSKNIPPTRDHPVDKHLASELPPPKEIKTHPTKAVGEENASLYFVGTATTLLEWQGLRIMTDPNFLHAGDHVHLGPGVVGTRVTNPAIDLHELPKIDLVLLSHYHADHFDEKVEQSLRRDLPIITTPHAKSHLAHKKGEAESFTSVYDLDNFESIIVDIEPRKLEKQAALKVTGMPGKHVPPGPGHILDKVNDLIKAVPPTNGWMIELGTKNAGGDVDVGYRIYISGDTLFVDDLKEIPERYKGQGIDLMLIHLGGTTIPSPALPLLMVTMDAEQGLKLVQLINPDLTIPIHYDDYNVFLSPLDDFKKKMEEAGLADKVVYLDRKDQYKFKVRD